MTSKKQLKPGDMFLDVFNRSVELVSDLTTASAAAAMNAPLTSARSLVKFQKGVTHTGLNLVGKVKEYTEKSLRTKLEEDKLLPEEAGEVVDEWAKMMDSGLSEFSKVVDKSYEQMLKYLERVEKETGKKETKLKTAAEKTTIKKVPAKKTTTPKPASKKKPE